MFVVRLIILFLIAMSPIYFSHAQDAVETIGENDLSLRGQGGSPWCFAFAEEQAIKDTFCSGPSCASNANSWYASVFDIVKSHADAYGILFGGKPAGETAKSLFYGSSNSFPYVKDGTRTIRSSRCTLEKDIFFINRSSAFNSGRSFLYDQLKLIWNDLKNEQRISLDATIASYQALIDDKGTSQDVREFVRKEIPNLRERKRLMATPRFRTLFATLSRLALQSKNADAFVNRIINFTSCSDRVHLPAGNVQERTLTNSAELSRLLSQVLSDGKSVVLGVCAEVLRDETDPGSKCLGHAVAVKSERSDAYLIVDSAFFSDRPKNSDGSQWIPKSIVQVAVVKNGQNLEKVMRDYETSMAKLSEEINAMTTVDANEGTIMRDMEAGIDQMMVEMNAELVGVAPQDLKTYVVQRITEANQGENSDDDESGGSRELIERKRELMIEFREGLISGVASLDIKSHADLAKIRDVYTRLATEFYRKQIEALNASYDFDSLSIKNINLSGNVVWISN